jgi:DNA-binding CsgD family transcriptional regulator
MFAINQDMNITPRELEVLTLIAQEHTTIEMAHKLCISKATIESHRKNLIVKFEVRNSVGLIKKAIEKRIL